jgi:VCBS repeat-containing protein
MRTTFTARLDHAPKKGRRSTSAVLETLEPRVLFSALPPIAGYEADGLPILNSNPDAPVAIHMDFRYESLDGERLRFNPSGSPTTIDALEQDLIVSSWAKTAAAYAPFDINVTTQAPDPDTPFILAAIYRTPSGPGSGGGARSFGFMPLQDYINEGRVDFQSGRVGDGLLAQSWIREGAIWGADVVTHETAHSQWISGHETADTEANRIGVHTMPIVGGPFTRSSGPHGAWFNWYTEYIWPENPDGFFFIQDDVQKIANGIIDSVTTFVDPNYAGDGMRPDDHGGTTNTATAMPFDPGSSTHLANGIIERLDDTDVLSFDWAGGTAWVGVSTAQPNSLLDARFTVKDVAGNVVAVSDQADSEQSAVRLNNLAAGTYYIEINSDGDYSELGLYQATVSSSEPQTFKRLAHLPFDGNSLADASGQDNHGTWVGGAQWTTGRDGSTAARFNGSNRIDVIHNGALASEDNFTHVNENLMGRTFAFWFKADGTGGSQTLFEDPMNSNGYRIFLEDGQLKVDARNSGTLSDWDETTTLTSPGAVNAGEWHHVALTHEFTFSTNPDTLKLYLDGQVVATGDAGHGPKTDTFRIGSGFNGAIDDVHILSDVPPAHVIAEWADNADLSQLKPTGTAINMTAFATHDTVSLSWDAVAGATGYNVLRSDDGQNFELIATVDANSTSFDDTGLLGSHQYFYAVDTQGADGVGEADVLTRAGAIRYAQYTKVRNPNPDDFWATKMDLWGHGVDGLHAIALGFFDSDGHRDTDILIERSTDGVNFEEAITLPATESIYYDNGPDHNGLIQGETYTYRLTPIDDMGPVTSAAIILETEPLTFIPETEDDSANGSTDPIVIDVLDNDSDFDNDDLSVSAVTQGQYGSVTINPDNTVTYQVTDLALLASQGTLVDTFTYTADDGFNGLAEGTVTVAVRSNAALDALTRTAYIDFGDSSTTGTVDNVTYNDVSVDNKYSGGQQLPLQFNGATETTDPLALRFANNALSGWGLEIDIVNNYGTVADNGGQWSGPYPTELDAIQDTALRSMFYFNRNMDISITLTGLDDNEAYNLLIYNGNDQHGNASNSILTYVPTVGTGVDYNSQQINSYNNTTDVTTWDAVTPVNGVIQFTIEGDHEAWLNFMSIERVVDETIPGDTDGDGDIDDADLGTAFANYTGPLGPGEGTKTFEDGDTDGDGDIDDADLGTAFAAYTGPIAAAVQQAAVPDRAAAYYLYESERALTKPTQPAFNLFQLDEDDPAGFDGLSSRVLGESLI